MNKELILWSPKMCGKLKRVWYFYLYFNCQQLN